MGLLLLLLAACSDEPGIDFEAVRAENYPSEFLDRYQNSDSLIKVTQEYSGARKKIDSLLFWTEILTNYDEEAALEYANEAYRISTAKNKKLSRAISLYYQAVLKKESAIYGENSETALADAQNSYKLLQKIGDPEWKIKVNHLLSNLFLSQENFDSAKYYLTESLEVLSQSKLPGDLPYNLRGQTLHYFANIYSMVDSTQDKAFDYYEEARRLYSQSENQKRMLDLYTGLGLLYMNRGEYHQADSLLRISEALSIVLNERNDLANIYNNLGSLKLSQWYTEPTDSNHYFKQAMSYIQKGIPLQRENFYYPYTLMGYAYHRLYYYNSLKKSEDIISLNQAIIYYKRATQEASKEGALSMVRSLTEYLFKLCDERLLLTGESCDSLLEATRMEFIHQNYAGLVASNKNDLKLASDKITEFEKKEQVAINQFRLRNSYFTGAVALIFSIFIFLLLLQRQQQKRLQARMAALRAQINPHFMSNSLNAIESLVNQGENKAASKYLIHFSRLTRRLLNSSRAPRVSLSEEFKTLEHFLALEQLRFRDKLDYELEIAPDLNPERIEVPAMILQPYLENAILHGIKPKSGPGKLWIRAKRMKNKLLVEVEDNGVGRKKAQELKDKSVFKHQSHGQSITEERIRIFAKSKGAKVSINDLTNNLGDARGTKVIIELPWKERKEQAKNDHFQQFIKKK